MQPITRFTDGLNRVLGWVVGIFLAASSAAVFIQIVIRFVLPLFNVIIAAPWTEEISRYLMVWVVFIGVAVLCRNFRMIAVEILALLVPRPVGIALKLLSVAICIGFFAVIVNIGFRWTTMSSIELSPVLRLPMNWVYIAMPVGALIAIFNLLVVVAETLTGERNLLEGNEEVLD
ncbi:TRAP transporter small permease [Rhizobiaceae bacterium BDR2-2]|uniref:TRAP transporter small permease protein n=1 Tax=Ectorhizobium quercum TaxID=2965071 RepID=A0AAE3MXZ3_9HYPH|nr:TRAP transporter small permease [Ectorhizobium quercum]MCX8997024.1 TRAP transporter small permease [Ectorhizobium quercum]